MKKNYFLFMIMVVGGLNFLCILLYARLPYQPDNSPLLHRGLLTGDIVVRRSYGMVSKWFAEMSRQDPIYSHAGIIKTDGKTASVVNCSNELGLHTESFDEFTSADRCERYAVYRLNLSPGERKKLNTVFETDLKNKIKFDNDFQLDNGNTFYCSEYIRSSIQKLKPCSVTIPCSVIGDWKYVSIDNLYLNTGTHLLYSSYKPD